MPATLKLVPQPTGAALRLLVVTRESAVLRPLWSIGDVNGWQMESATNGWGAMERVQSGVTPDLLILDLPRADTDGLHFLRWLRRLHPELPILVLCDQDDLPAQREAIRLGARDFVVRPPEDEVLERAIRQLSTEVDSAAVEITSDYVEEIGGDRSFVGAIPVMRKLRAQVELLAETDTPVLIVGEIGSGKETTARLIHHLSVRSSFKFAKVNCAALPSDLLEAELFGYERNGTAPAGVKTGKLELCEKGSILLDEITEMPTSLQSKLLQVLQNKKFARPGSGAAVPVDVRILIASTSNLEPAIADNKLCEDLFYRLSIYTVRVPPLRERRQEVPLLLHNFMRHLSKQYGLSARVFSPALLEACQSHDWPGNLPEMENFVKRFLLAGGKALTLSDEPEPQPDGKGFASIQQNGFPALPPPSHIGISGSDSLKSVVQTVKLEAEKNAIAAALERTGWNRKAAARLLQVSYRTLLSKIEQYHMKSPDSLVPGVNGIGPNGNGNGFGGKGRAH